MFILDTIKKTAGINGSLIHLIVILNIILLSILLKVLNLLDLVLIRFPYCPRESFFAKSSA
jgi:hypothetical protein